MNPRPSTPSRYETGEEEEIEDGGSDFIPDIPAQADVHDYEKEHDAKPVVDEEEAPPYKPTANLSTFEKNDRLLTRVQSLQLAVARTAQYEIAAKGKEYQPSERVIELAEKFFRYLIS